jgi:hypothetical protein
VNIATFLLGLAVVAGVWGLVAGISIYESLRRRGEKVSFIWLKWSLSLVLVVFAASCSPKPESRPTPFAWDLEGEYLGQKPPGHEVELFAPGFISTAMSEANSVFSPDGSEFWFAVWPGPGHGPSVFSTRMVNGRWTIPEVPEFLRGVSAIDVAITADGQRFFFCSNRPRTPGGPKEDNFDIWYVDRQLDGSWGEPVNPGQPLNSDRHDYYPTVTLEGTMYFHSSREGGLGGRDIYRAEVVEGLYQTPENVGPVINTSGNEGDVLVAPDESFLIFNSHGHDSAGGGSSLWISFRGEDGSWLPPRNLSHYIAGDPTDFCPMLSPDGRYLFFSSNRIDPRFAGKDLDYQTLRELNRGPGGGFSDVYWVDSSIIERAREQSLGAG